MVIKKIKDWFVKNILLPNNEVIDKPGCILQQFNEQDKQAFLREMLFPETVLAQIESTVSKKYGKRGRDAIYKAGKRWGYRYAKGTMFPLRKGTSEKDFLGFMNSFTKMIEAEYSEKFTGKPDLANDSISFEGKNMVVCKKSGQGQLFLGAWVGCWAYQHQDLTMEGVHPECEGRHDKKCIFICSPRERLKNVSCIVKKDSSLDFELGFYSLNAPHFSKTDYSLRRFMELGTITYGGGFFRFGKERLVLNESSSLYFLEEELMKIHAGSLVFDAAFDYFYQFGKVKTPEFFIGFLMACGFGEIELYPTGSEFKAVVRNFPWTSLAKKSKFLLLQGAFSGFLSSKVGRKIRLDTVKSSTASGHLEVILSGN